MRTICVTGLAGFIGFHCALALAKRGDRVIGFDNFDPFYSVALKRARVEKLKALGIECESLELSDSRAVSDFFKRHRVDGVIHLAAQAGVRYSIEQPLKFVSSNLAGFVNMLEGIKEQACPFVYASSSSIYGMNSKVPFTETDRTDQPVSLYGATKKSNELIAHAYHHLYQIPMTGLRFFTVYGPWGRPDMACWLFTEAIFDEKPIRLFNEGKMKRDFTYIDDIVEGVLSALEKTQDFDLYNLGGSHSHELNQFVSLIEQAVGKKAIIEKLPMQMGDVTQTYADITLSQKSLGFEPKTSLAEGIPQFVDWYRYWRSR